VVVLCAGSTLLLVQSKVLDEAPYKLSGAVAKLAYITFRCLAFSYWFDKPRFLTEGKFAAVLILLSSWGSQLGGHLARIRRSIFQMGISYLRKWAITPPKFGAPYWKVGML
jgi:hypothetical protein